MSASLTWIVPGRRAVVQKRATYAQVFAAWIDELPRCREAFARWYSLADGKFWGAYAVAVGWHGLFFNTACIDACRDGLATIDSKMYHFRVRLWKGPARVLRETADQAVGPKILDPIETVEPNLLLNNDTREVENFDALFLMGDVVEFPLWKILAAGGKGDFGALPRYDDVLTFDGKGSYLLGTSVKKVGSAPNPGDPPPEPLLHDNLTAMRFQTVLGCYIGSYYHNKAVYKDQSRAVSASDGSDKVFARGMMYSGVLFFRRKKTGKRNKLGFEYWSHYTNEWGRSPSGSRPICMPTKSGLAGLVPDLPVTGGSVCSDTALLLMYYMMRLHDGSWGRGSVGRTMSKHPDSPMHGHYEMWTAAEIAKLVPAVTPDELKEKGERLLKLMPPVRDLALGEDNFVKTALTQAEKQPDWSFVDPKRAAKLASKTGAAKSFMSSLKSMLYSRRVKSPERAVLIKLHKAVVLGVVQFAKALDQLMQDDAWIEFDTPKFVSPYFAGRGVKWAVDAVMKAKACPKKSKCNVYHGAQWAVWVAKKLDSKKKRLEKLLENPKRLERKVSIGYLDLSPHLSDVNTVSTNGHEWCIVRLYNYDKLLLEQDLPRAGFVAGFDPLSGETYGPTDGDIERGQFWVFEEGASLGRWTTPNGPRKKQVVFGARPFKWAKVENNHFAVKVDASSKNRQKVYFGASRKVRGKRLLKISRIKGAPSGGTHLKDAHLAAPETFRPLVVVPTKGNDKATYGPALDRMMTNVMDLYQARALPFVTIGEAKGGFADHAEVAKWYTKYDFAAEKQAYNDAKAGG